MGVLIALFLGEDAWQIYLWSAVIFISLIIAIKIRTYEANYFTGVAIGGVSAFVATVYLIDFPLQFVFFLIPFLVVSFFTYRNNREI